jgi:F-type H+-transporting ATPase subunit a
MSNLFSIFDPLALTALPLNWASSRIVVLAVPNLFWLLKSQILALYEILIKFVNSEFSAITGPALAPGGTLLSLALFLFIVLNNFFGLFPYVFTSPAHLTFTVVIALPLWAGHMAIAWAKTPNNTLAHLVPLGTPVILMPFIVLIELTRRVIRPLTLSVRLAANMVAGHLLLTLLRSQAPSSGLLVIAPLILSLILLGILESAVAVIQAYVFRVLMTLYVNEVNSPQIRR